MTTPLRVLVVEDSEDDALLLIQELRQGGYEPAWARVDSATALTEALDSEWDLILADYSLPNFSGPAALELLKARGTDVPMIMVSGMVSEETAIESLHAGARDFIPKDNLRRLVPAARRELMEAKGRMERRKAEEALRDSEATLRSFYDSAPTLMGIVELPGDDILHLYDNAATARFLRHPVGATEGKLATELGAPAPAIAEWRRHYLESSRTGTGVHFDYEHPSPDGPRWLGVTVAPIRAGPSGAMRYCYVAEDVTERRLAQEALRAAEQRYKMLVEHIPAITYIAAVDDASTTLYISPQVETILGIPPAEWIADAETWVRGVHEDDRPRVLDELARGLRRGDLFTCEYRFLTPDGRTVWLRDEAFLVTDTEGHPTVQGVLLDITASKLAEDQLARSERWFRSLIENATDLVTLLDASGRITYQSPSVVRLVGGGPEARIGHEALEFVHPDDRATVQDALMGGVVAGAATGRMLYRMRDREGGWRVLESVGTNLLADPAVRAIVVNTRDVTEAVMVREALQQRSDELAERVKEVSCLYAASDVLREDEVQIPDLFSRVVSLIPSGWRFPELAEARLTVEGREYATPGFRHTEWCALASVPFGPDESGTLEVCYRERPPIGESEVFLPEEQSLLHRLVEKIAEMVQRRHTEAQLRQAQKMEAVGRLAGGVAHDFNNLLTVIKGRAQFGVEDLKESDPFRKDVLEILEAAEQAQNLTRQLLAFSRQQVATPRVVEAAEMLRSAEKMLRRLIGEDVELHVTAAAELGRVRVDPTQVDQVLMNLAINARDAMPGGGRLSIYAEDVGTPDLPLDGFAEPFEAGQYVRIRVTDTGTGMSPETQRRIFEPFFTTKPPGRGTGLGLSTVFGIVKQSGGFIRVQSEEGVGSTFEVYLPRTDEEPEPRYTGPRSATVATGSETILVVEDNPAVRSVLHRSLERAGYRVCEAADGSEALTLWGRQAADIDLVLTDMVMPHMGGAELASRLRADRPDLPIILMSGYTEDEVLQRMKLDPGIERLEKPFEEGELQQKIRDVLGGS